MMGRWPQIFVMVSIFVSTFVVSPVHAGSSCEGDSSPNCCFNRKTRWLNTLRDHKNDVLSVAFDPTGKFIVSASWDEIKVHLMFILFKDLMFILMDILLTHNLRLERLKFAFQLHKLYLNF